MVYNVKWHISPEDLNNLNKRTTSLGSKGSDQVVSDDKSDLDNIYMITSEGSKGSDKGVSDVKPDLDNLDMITSVGSTGSDRV